MSDRQRHGFVLLLVAGLIAASLLVAFTQRTQLGLDLKGGTELVYEAKPTAQHTVNSSTLTDAVNIMRQRVDQLGVSEPEIQTSGDNEISVGLPDVHNTAQAEQEVGTTARLAFYDWEANVLTPDGKTVASQLITQDPTAVELSQGSSFAGAGTVGAGSVPLYQAVKLAASLPASPSRSNARKGNEYYLFGAPGSAACATAARDLKTTPAAGQHCMLLHQPVDEPTSVSQRQLNDDLQSALLPGISLSQGQPMVVRQGWVVLLAAPDTPPQKLTFASPSAQFFVLRDDVALFGNEITNPQASTDSGGNPDVTFDLTSQGAAAFQRVTAQIAHRGELVSPVGRQYNQHFAVALDKDLITAPQIVYKQYADGIIGSSSEITGGFTTQSATELATLLREGALPVTLQLISENDVSATLGAQSLHQAILAGAAGLLVVALFLIFYYRLLGVIATAALAVYALYFYALIKLIPITLTLPGIAGLILTIGVAADANIVIFERVKEEIRAGRSIRAGIATGYKKGLTAIIDANVVTIMTAFILFVLATAQVQGFAFTLGVGTIVSLFTAVMATQAILLSMGDSRMIARPSALGAGAKHRTWRFDFMGASKYFFSMSGVILLVGALAIGGKGLNLGIDFTSGTRINVTLSHPATSAQISQVASANGAISPQVQKLGNKSTEYQISTKFKGASTQDADAIQRALIARYGVTNWNDTSVGPTFGRTVANSAIIAIIASLLVISAYVALRFEWKFAVPVLIALMHDLLITSGVYALTGRQVTVDTVAALLTILGYSLYDTIIVFDRVRENIPRMPRAAFSQIVNRSMSEVLTRSLATTSCTLLPIVALLLFGGATLQDFAFALLIGVASGAYSSIFIASPVLTHWKEREPGFRARRHRIETELGAVPAYAAAGSDVEPARQRARTRTGRLTQPEPETLSAAEFEQLKRDIAEEELEPRGRTSTLTKRLAHVSEEDVEREPMGEEQDGGGQAARQPSGRGAASPTRSQRTPTQRPARQPRPPRSAPQPPTRPGSAPPSTGPGPAPPRTGPGSPPPPAASEPPSGPPATPPDGTARPPLRHAPDEPENEGVARPSRADRPKPRSRNRRHGRRR